jgi:hypothetical protein
MKDELIEILNRKLFVWEYQLEMMLRLETLIAAADELHATHRGLFATKQHCPDTFLRL